MQPPYFAISSMHNCSGMLFFNQLPGIFNGLFLSCELSRYTARGNLPHNPAIIWYWQYLDLPKRHH